MLALTALLSLASVASAAVPYQEYILAPCSRTIRPVSVFSQQGPLLSQDSSLTRNGCEVSEQSLILTEFNSSVTYDFGKNIAGWINLDVVSANGSVGITFSESSLWISAQACDATADAGLDAPLVFNITTPGRYSAPREKERGAFRYLTIVNLGTSELDISDLWVHFTAMPHWDDSSLQDYTGWFHSNDEKLNRVWYAGAYTNQLVTIDPTRGDALNFIDTVNNNSTINGNLDWWVNTTISAGRSTLTDGAKRDRLVWSGDMSIAVPGIAVTTFDLVSIRNALDSLFKLQKRNGQLPYAGIPFNERGIVSFTYHLYALIGVANFYHWSGDKRFLAEKWSGWKSGIKWATQQIDKTGLANITAPADWLRFGMGGHNIEANSILFYTLKQGATLAATQHDVAFAARCSRLAAGIQTAAMPLLWQPSVGLFRDNETTTLAPQDGNAWAVKSGLVASPAQITQISSALQARWGPYGAPAPEAADAVSPFISGFELETHFLANRTSAALALVRRMWADFMLDDPRMTNSTFIEGYSVSGALHYAPYSNDARISHAHGWATGPTSSLTTYVAGIHILSAAGETWAIAPQLGDLTHVDAGFSTSKGRFSSLWTVNGSVFTLAVSTPRDTMGTISLPFPGTHTTAALARNTTHAGTVSADTSTQPVRIRADRLGRYTMDGLPGGDYQFVVTGI